MKATRITLAGQQDSITLSDVVFGGEVNPQLLAQAVRVYRARNRQGTSATKTRSYVNRTKKKWFKQKGTGNARHGARSSNIFVGGGVSHGPTSIQNWSLTLPKKMRIQALITAFAAQNGNIFVSDALNEVKNNRDIRKMITQVQDKTNLVLVILPKTIESTILALRNMEAVKMMTAQRVNALDIVQADKIVIADTALEILENRILGKADTTKRMMVEAPVVKAETTTKTATKTAAKPVVKKTVAKKPVAATKTTKVKSTEKATPKAAPKAKTKAKPEATKA